MGEERIFALVDTNTLSVTLFSAVRPPVAVVLCGEEGGMQRALLCSYDWSTQTLYRETVMRMSFVDADPYSAPINSCPRSMLLVSFPHRVVGL